MIKNINENATINSYLNDTSASIATTNSLAENSTKHIDLQLQDDCNTEQLINKQDDTNKLACFYNRQAVYVVDDDKKKQAIIAHYQIVYPEDKLAVIKSPEDLNTNNIIRKISYNAETGVNIVNGDLLDSAPFTLVIDLSAMTTSEISSLNELLDKSPKYEGKPLSDNIRIAVIITNNMLFKKNRNTPGSDCWRRLQQLSKFIYAHDLIKQEDFNSTIIDNEELLATNITNTSEIPENSSNSVIIDFMVNQSWEELLFGSIALDEKGKLFFQQSKLIEAKENYTIILQNAPWDDTKFKESIVQLIRYNKFTTNCEEIELPANINFVYYNIKEQQFIELKQQLLTNPNTINLTKLTNYICLNSFNIEHLFSNIQYTDSGIKKINRLLELTGTAEYIVITEKLTACQWLKLISLLKQTPNSYKIIKLEENKKLLLNNKVQLISYGNQEHMLEALKPNYDLAYQITSQTNWDDLWQLLEMSSQKNLKFNIKSSELLQVAIAEKRILLYGLEKNINLCKNLESLLTNKPYIFINGNKILLPNLELIIAVPNTFTVTTALWKQLKHNILHLDNPTSKYDSLFTKLTQLPESINKKYPNKIPWHDSNFSKIIEKHVRLELIKDNAKQVTMKHYQQALNILIAEAYKEDAEIYAYITIVIADYCNSLPTMANKQQLAQWLATNPQATTANITDDFWQLLACCPINDYPQLIPESFDDIENTKDTCINLIVNYLIQSVAKKQQQYWQQHFEYTEELINADKLEAENNTSVKPINLVQQQKLKHLIELIITHPILFFKGDSGSGKSFMAQTIAKSLKQIYANSEAAITLNIGPKTSVEDIFGAYKLVTKANDSHLEFIDGPILAWAKNENPPLLIIDEANLAPEGVLAPLAGVTLTQPTIDFQGSKYNLTAKHRVILTGNFNSYSGRNMDSSLNSKVLCIHFDAMNQQQLTELIIKPNLPINWEQSLQQQCIKQILLLYSYYNKFYDNSLSARDLHSILIRLNTTVKFNSNNNITLAQINSLVWQSCFDTLARNLTNEKNINKLQALQDWHNANYQLDDSIMAPQELAFNSFLTKLRLANNDIDLFIKPMINLVRDYWLFLESNARKGMIVEGPAGYGKDCILSRVLLLWLQTQQYDLQFIHINANLNNIDQLVNCINDAKNNGKVIIISELNILPSELLEGILNNALTGDSHANFKLFATINSATEVNGRQELSNAFKNRCTKVKLKKFSRSDYYQLLQRRSFNTELNNYIATYFFVLSQELTKNKHSVQLCVDDLFRVADALITSPKNMWQQTIKKELYLASLFISEDKLIATITTYNQSTNDLQSITTAISQHINNNSSEPIVINLVKNSRSWFDFQNKVLTLPICNNNSIADYIDAANFIINETTKPKLLPAVSHKIPTIYYSNYFDTDDNNFSAREYRLHVKHLIYRNDKIELYTDTFISTAVFKVPDFPDKQLLLNEYDQIGVFTVPNSNKWTVLPGFTPNDILKYLACDYPVLITKCDNTGQLYIKIITDATVSNITIKFLITTDNSYFKKINSNDTVFNREVCDYQLKQWLDDNIFSYKNLLFNSCVELQRIQQITNKTSQINALVNWCKSFNATKHIEINTTEDLQKVIYNKIGVCRHRCLVFIILAEYLNIKARMIANQLHAFIEIKLQNGQYKKLDLEGGQANLQKIESNCKHNIDYKKVVSSKLNNSSIYRYKDANGSILNEEFFEVELTKIINGKIVLFTPKELIFMFNKLNFIDYFIKHIKNMVVNSIEKKSYIVSCINSIFYNNSLISISENQLNSMLSSVLSFSDIIETAHVLPILTYLATIPIYSLQTQQLLNVYYKSLSKQQQSFAGAKKIEASKKLQLTNYLYNLAPKLQKTKVEKQWSYTSNGFAPNITRLIELKPAFLHTVIKNDNTIFLPMRFPQLFDIYNNCKFILQNYGLQLKKENFFYIAINFFEFLFGSLNNCKFKIISFDNNLYEHPVTKETINIMTGVYKFPEDLEVLIYSSLKPANYFIYDVYKNVNIQTLREIYNEPTGIIIDEDTIEDAVYIFKDSINHKKLVQHLVK